METIGICMLLLKLSGCPLAVAAAMAAAVEFTEEYWLFMFIMWLLTLEGLFPPHLRQVIFLAKLWYWHASLVHFQSPARKGTLYLYGVDGLGLVPGLGWVLFR